MRDALAEQQLVRTNALQRTVRWLAETRAGAWTLARTLRHIDRAVLRISRGRTTASAWLAALPLVVLRTTGVRSGQERTAVVVGIPVPAGLAVVAGNFGEQRPPAWAANLVAHPDARIEIRGRSVPVVATLLEGRDREEAWTAACLLYPPYQTYAARVPTRSIEVFRLSSR